MTLMLMKWLEPAINKRIEEVSDEWCIDERIKELYMKFMEILDDPNNFYEDTYKDLIFELENT